MLLYLIEIPWKKLKIPWGHFLRVKKFENVAVAQGCRFFPLQMFYQFHICW